MFYSYEDDEVVQIPVRHIRPRARHKIPFNTIENGANVMVNYNYDEPTERGYWYDAIITDKRDTRTIKELDATVYIGLVITYWRFSRQCLISAKIVHFFTIYNFLCLGGPSTCLLMPSNNEVKKLPTKLYFLAYICGCANEYSQKVHLYLQKWYICSTLLCIWMRIDSEHRHKEFCWQIFYLVVKHMLNK